LRTVIVHYHIFKNAGSTFDSMLEATFGERWANFDKPQAAAYITPDEMAEFILANPDLAAVSSHHAVLPLPEIPGVTILPALFLRHPLDRARSVYDFERRQGIEAGPVSKGAEQAAKLSFAEYLRWRLDATVNGVVANFQTVRLIHDPKFNRHKLTEDDFQLAWRRLRELQFVGLVEDFDTSINRFSVLANDHLVNFKSHYVTHNQSQRESSLGRRLKKMRLELGELTWNELIIRNEMDIRIYELENLNFISIDKENHTQ
jgi:hypothetical protein